MIKNLIDAIAMGDTLAIDDSFNTIMANKISERLDDMRISVAQGMFGSVNESEEFYLEDYSVEELEDFMMSEEFEQLDELSQKTVSKYIHKAAPEGTSLDSLPDRRRKGVLLALQKKYPSVTFKGKKVKVPSTNESINLTKEAYERGDMGTDNSPKGSARGSSLHSMDIAKQSGYTHAVMHMGTKGGIDSYHTTKAGAEKKLASLRKKHNIPENSPRARIAEL